VAALVFDRWQQATIDKALASARAKTDPAVWDEAWAAGSTLTLEEAAAEILAT
jgi:hypothetical protein